MFALCVVFIVHQEHEQHDHTVQVMQNSNSCKEKEEEKNEDGKGAKNGKEANEEGEEHRAEDNSWYSVGLKNLAKVQNYDAAEDKMIGLSSTAATLDEKLNGLGQDLFADKMACEFWVGTK